MGTWGTAISSNDTYTDVYSDFFELYNAGCDVVRISEKLKNDYRETIEISEDANNFWFALAKAQWECKQLDPEVFQCIKTIIQTDADIEVWRQLDADEKDIKKRKVYLNKFLADIEVERPKARARKKKIIKILEPIFEKGDCLTFKLENGNYGGIVILEALKNTEYGHNMLAATRINQQRKPQKEDFEKAEVLILNYGSHKEKAELGWYSAHMHKSHHHIIEKVASIKVDFEYDLKSNMMLTFFGDLELSVIKAINGQFESELIKPRSKIKQTIKSLTQKRKWWQL